MNESKKGISKNKITLYENTVTFEEFKEMNKEEIILPLGIIVEKPELNTLIKVANEYCANLSLIGLLMYYDKLEKDSESDMLYFKLNSNKILQTFDNQEFSFEFICDDYKKKHIDRIYNGTSDVMIDFVDKVGILNLKKTIETTFLQGLISSSIAEYFENMRKKLGKEKCKVK